MQINLKVEYQKPLRWFVYIMYSTWRKSFESMELACQFALRWNRTSRVKSGCLVVVGLSEDNKPAMLLEAPFHWDDYGDIIYWKDRLEIVREGANRDCKSFFNPTGYPNRQRTNRKKLPWDLRRRLQGIQEGWLNTHHGEI